ncbi:ATP-binding cassette domain-containing protein [Planctomycetota bacterium]
MDILLQHVCPSFLTGTGSQVWNRDVHLPEKAFVNVTAPSGVGKTSFIAVLYGLLTDYGGTLQFDGKETASIGRRKWAHLRQHKLSLMFQDLRLFDQLSCLDNVLLKACQVGQANPQWIETLFERLGIHTRLHALAGSCSQGEKQRVAFIRALVQPFAWILLDEPFSHLDEDCVGAMCDLLLETCDRNHAGMIVTSLAPDTRLPYTGAFAL